MDGRGQTHCYTIPIYQSSVGSTCEAVPSAFGIYVIMTRVPSSSNNLVLNQRVNSLRGYIYVNGGSGQLREST